AIVSARSRASATARRSAANFAVLRCVERYWMGETETSVPLASKFPTVPASRSSLSIWLVWIEKPWLTCHAGTARKAGFFKPVGTLIDTCVTWIGGFEIAPGGRPPWERNASVWATFERSALSAAAG